MVVIVCFVFCDCFWCCFKFFGVLLSFLVIFFGDFCTKVCKFFKNKIHLIELKAYNDTKPHAHNHIYNSLKL